MMRTETLLCIIAFLFLACNSDNKVVISKSGDFKTIDELLLSEIDSGIKADTLFLDYMFGMSQDNFTQHTRQLLKDDRIQTSAENTVFYSLVTPDNQEFNFTWSPDFIDNELVELVVSAEMINTDHLYLPLSQIVIYPRLISNYGYADYEIEKYLGTDCSKYGWIDGNRHIELLCGIDDVRIFYTDERRKLRREQEELASEKMRMEKKRMDNKSSASDF